MSGAGVGTMGIQRDMELIVALGLKSAKSPSLAHCPTLWFRNHLAESRIHYFFEFGTLAKSLFLTASITMARPSAVGLIALLLTLVSHVTAQCVAATGRFTPKMAAGYRAKAIFTGLRSPRGIVVDSQGNLLVAETGGNGIRRLVMTESGTAGEVCVKSSSMLITGAVVSAHECHDLPPHN